MDIENIKNILKQCYSNNQLEFWDKNEIEPKLIMKENNKIIREKPMRYNEKDKKNF